VTSLARRTWTSLLAFELWLGKELRTASEPFPKSSLVPGTNTFKICSGSWHKHIQNMFLDEYTVCCLATDDCISVGHLNQEKVVNRLAELFSCSFLSI